MYAQIGATAAVTASTSKQQTVCSSAGSRSSSSARVARTSSIPANATCCLERSASNRGKSRGALANLCERLLCAGPKFDDRSWLNKCQPKLASRVSQTGPREDPVCLNSPHNNTFVAAVASLSVRTAARASHLFRPNLPSTSICLGAAKIQLLCLHASPPL